MIKTAKYINLIVGAALVVLAIVNLISFGGGTFNPFTIAMKLFLG